MAKGLAERVWRIRLRDVSRLAIVGHAVLDSANAQRDALREGTRKDRRRLPWLGIPPLAQGVGNIGRVVDHPIHLPLAVVDADGAEMAIDGRPSEGTDFPDPETTAPHQEKHRAVT